MASIGAATLYATTASLSILVLGLYILGAARYLTNLEENACEMTYMFEYPQYVRIALDEKIEERYPRYGLYVYGEGFVTEKHRRMKFSGIPVLFIPGNAGSHEQVRSLASVSLRKSIKDRTPFHFDYFTVSLGKDYSALYGGVLEDQTTYVSFCISKILSLYKGNVDEIVLIGHSMGGIVAKAVLLRESTSPSSNVKPDNRSVTSILVTLASPHKPNFLPDRTIARYYENLESSISRVSNVTGTSLVSVAGGRRDILVSTSQTIEPSADLNVVSSGIPKVWLSTDHLCILWCKQLIMTIVRALFDCVDVNNRLPKITSDPGTKIRALSYHFTSRILGKKIRPYEDRVKFERGGEWIEDIRRQYTWNDRGTVDKTLYLMIRVGNAALSYDSISIEAINLEAGDWLFACLAHGIEANSRVCEWGWNLTNRTSLSPDSTRRSRKSADIRLEDLRGLKISHVVVRIPAEELRNSKKANAVKIHVDLHNREDRTLRLEDDLATDAVGLFSVLPVGRILSPNPYGVLKIAQGSLRYCAVLSGIEDAVAVEMEPRNDETDSFHSSPLENDDEPPQAIFELIEPSGLNQSSRSGGQVRAIVADNKKNGQYAKKRLIMYLTGKNNAATLRISTSPEYSYRIVIRRAGIVDRVACSVRDRWPTIYSIVVSFCLLGIVMRLDDCARATAITIGIYLVGAASVDFLFESLVALGLLHVVAVTACFLVIFSGSIVHNVTARFLARIVSVPSAWFEWLLGGFDRLPILTTFILLSLISATCGAIAMLLSVPIYFLKLTRMYNEYLEELFMASLRQFLPRLGRGKRKSKRRDDSGAGPSSTDIVAGSSNDSDHKSTPSVSTSEGIPRGALLNHLLLFVTWSFAAVPALPSAFVWAKNFRYETRLTTEDPVMLISWLILTCWGSLGFVEIPTDHSRCRKNRRKLCANALRLVAFFIAFTATIERSAYYQWTVAPLVALAVTCLALLSLLPGDTTEDDNRLVED